jgi:methylthioribose-1-phosphate isomerase
LPIVKELKPLEWKDDSIVLIDQTVLPQKLEYKRFRDHRDVIAAIKTGAIRGALAQGVAAAFALVLASRKIEAKDTRDFFFRLNAAKEEILGSDPSSFGISNALAGVIKVAEGNRHLSPKEIRGVMVHEASRALEDISEVNRKIGKNGSALIKAGSSILTHSNSGIFYSVDYGTALGIIRAAGSAGKVKMVYVLETRPSLSGIRLTAFELASDGLPVTVITDNAAAELMRQGKVDLTVVGAERIASNGDVVGDIGTYSLAALSKEHGVPFWAAAPTSLIDLDLLSGGELKTTDAGEQIEKIIGNVENLKGVQFMSPSRDVTPRLNLNAIVTEDGVLKPPFRENIKALLRKKHNG